MRKVLIWSLYTYPAAPNPPTTPTSTAPASSVPVSAPEPPPSPSSSLADADAEASSSFFFSSAAARRSLGPPPPPPPKRKGTLGEALRSVPLSDSRSEESGGWKARRWRQRHDGEQPCAGGEKLEESTGEGESCCGERRCGCLMGSGCQCRGFLLTRWVCGHESSEVIRGVGERILVRLCSLLRIKAQHRVEGEGRWWHHAAPDLEGT